MLTSDKILLFCILFGVAIGLFFGFLFGQALTDETYDIQINYNKNQIIIKDANSADSMFATRTSDTTITIYHPKLQER